MYYIRLNTLEDTVARRLRSTKGKQGVPYSDEIYLFDNWNGFDYIAKYEKGEMVYRGRYLPKWFETLISLM